jgi:hypothetical protein
MLDPPHFDWAVEVMTPDPETVQLLPFTSVNVVPPSAPLPGIRENTLAKYGSVGPLAPRLLPTPNEGFPRKAELNIS